MNNKTNEKKYTLISYLIIGLATFIRLIYILNTTVYERTHDVGNYTLIDDGLINPGHLGYIEYIAKFNQLPDMNPFDMFSYYHPPLHHILSAIVVKLSLLCGASTDAAYENIQFLILIFAVISMIICYKILMLFTTNEKYIIAPLLLLCFHPSLIFMTAYVNNDMLTVLFEVLIIYEMLKWMRDQKLKSLLLTALYIGLGMCTKISVATLAAPVGIIMLIKLYESIKNGSFKKLFTQYCLFAVIVIPLGVSWTVRNLIKFHQKPGISSSPPGDIKYIGDLSLWTRLGWPASLGLDYPFYSEYGSISTNVWLIMFRTSIFAELRPDIIGFPLFMCQLAFILSALLGIACAVITVVINVIEIRKGNKKLGIFLLSGYVTVIATYVLFVIKYPCTCSCDFRYIVISLLYAAISIVQLKEFTKK